MKRNIIVGIAVILAFVCGWLVAGLFNAKARIANISPERTSSSKLDTKNWAQAVKLPGAFAMPVSELLYSSEKPSVNNFFGDGFCAYVVRVDQDDMRWFVENLTGDIRDARRGKFLPGNMPAYDWVMEWVTAQDKAKLFSTVDIDSLIKKKTILHRQEVEKNSSRLISNARIWIVDPDQNIIVFLNADT